MKRSLSLLGFVLGTVFTSQSQVTPVIPQDPGHLTCAHNVLYDAYCKKMGIDPKNNPALNAFEAELKQKAEELHSTKKTTRSGPTYIIPVVFHVVHVGGVENISDAQILDEIRVLNLDYRNLNSDTGDVIAAFKPIVADCEIEFRIAQKDALGNCVSGITRTFSDKTFTGDDVMVQEVNKNLNGSSDINNIRFPHNKYLNVWICVDPNGAAGYTNGPLLGAIFPNTDGIWIRHDYVGSIGTSIPSHSRCLTHEIGHWFSLSHTWGNTNNPGCDGTILTAPCNGDDNCTTDDGVADTPNTIGWTSCNLSGSTCGAPVDNVQNYMEYSYCSNMFTEGQKTKMYALLASALAGRNNLYTPTNLAATGIDAGPIFCAADFTQNVNFVCAGDSVDFTDLTYYGASGWNWIFGGGTPLNSTLQNPTITYNVPGTYDVGLIANDGTSTASKVKNNLIRVLDPVGGPAPFSEGFESVASIPNADFMVVDPDGEQAWKVKNGYGSTGSNCIMLDNFTFNEGGAKDVLISKTYDLSGFSNVQLHFKYAYKQRTSADVEKLKVYVSNNCGTSWSLRKQVYGSTLSMSSVQTSAFYPAASDWISYDVTNISTSFLTQGFMYKIEFESDRGNNIFLDDINLDVNVGIDENHFTPTEFTVYPNPVTSGATIQYLLPVAQNITVTLKDVLGKQLAVLDSGNKSDGNHSLQIGESQLPAKGMYFICLSNGVSTFTQKIVVQ